MNRERDWNEFWKEKQYTEGGVYGQPNEELLQLAWEFLKNRNNPNILDLASWDGRYTFPLSQHGEVTAMDISPDALSYLEQSSKGVWTNITRECIDVFQVLFQRRCYDLIMCSGLIEELNKDRQNTLVEGLQSWVKINGLLILRYVTEKKMNQNSEIEHVVDHSSLVQSFSDQWRTIRNSVEWEFRQAKVGRVIDSKLVRRYFRAATLIIQKL